MRHRRARRSVAVLIALVALIALPYGCQQWRDLPGGLSYAGAPRAVENIAFITDRTGVDAAGVRHAEQHIFDEVFAIIDGARRLVVLDMFLYNSYIGDAPPPLRRLSSEMTDRLMSQKRRFPDMRIVVITDPVNTVYGGVVSEQFERLRGAGIEVVITTLAPLKDSNPVYSLFWRVFVRPFGNAPGDALPNPFGEGRVSLRSYLALLNFKANHRKTLLADGGDDHLVALVTSANPHDGSSAHTNIAVRFDGPAAGDLLATENAVLAMSGLEPLQWKEVLAGPDVLASELTSTPVTVQVLTESRIKDAVIASLSAADRGDVVKLAMFYLSDRDIINALKSAFVRGVDVRVLLDPNKDAFGREKQGIPNRPVAHELRSAGLPVRWCDTHGEQCHMKMLLVEYGSGERTLIAGSANFTRRNLDDFNLETNVAVRGAGDAPVFADARAFFDLFWTNGPDRHFSADYAKFAERSRRQRWLYRFMEASGLSTF